MRYAMLVLAGAGITLAACGGSGDAGNGAAEATATAAAAAAPPKRLPGSWSSKIEITRLEGANVKPGDREQMEQMFAMFGGISVCMTPEAIAKEDFSTDIQKSSGAKDCTFDKRSVTGSAVEFSGTCERQGKKTRISAKGTHGAAAQDYTMTIESLDATGASDGVMEMHVTSKHNGECKPGDLRPPSEAAGAK